jgi:putative redox protein
MTAQILYEGQLRTKATHVYSGNAILTDAPLDNHGLAQHFSPTDLVATALGSCMLTIMGIAAQAHQISLAGLSIDVQKHMSAAPRKISAIDISIHFNKAIQYTDTQKQILEKAALNCPVILSLHESISKNVIFNYEA